MNDPEAVTVLGGTSAIGHQVAADAAAIRTQTSTIERLAGPTRFETAPAIAGTAEVAERHLEGGEIGRTAFLATGLAFADAWAAGQLAFHGHPILLTSPDEPHPAAARAIAEHDIEHVIIPGGTRAISSTVQHQVEAQGVTTDRVGGADRAGTAAQVAQLAVDEFDVVAEHVNVASAATFADALALGPHAGREHERGPGLFFPLDTGVLMLSRSATGLDGADGNDADDGITFPARAATRPAGTEQRDVIVACRVDEGGDELADDESHCTQTDGEPETDEAGDLVPRDDRLVDEAHHRWVAVEDVDAGLISGIVTDLGGEAMAGARVRITNGSDKTAVSRDDGGYQSGPLLLCPIAWLPDFLPCAQGLNIGGLRS